MPLYGGDTVKIVTFAKKPDNTALLDSDIDSATTEIFDSAGNEQDTGTMTWDSTKSQWFYNWASPTNIGDGDFFAKCTLTSSALQFVNTEWRAFSLRPNPV